MEKLILTNSILIKEIILIEEDMYFLNVDMTMGHGWQTQVRSALIRTDIKSLSELLRLENPQQSRKIEDVVVNMLCFGKPPKIDICELTGAYLKIQNSEWVLRVLSKELQLVDVFPTFYHSPLSTYLNLKEEACAEILEKTFNDFQKAFYLIERGYTTEEAAALTETNNALAVLTYNKIKEAFGVIENSTTSQCNEDIIEENFVPEKFVREMEEVVPF